MTNEMQGSATRSDDATGLAAATVAVAVSFLLLLKTGAFHATPPLSVDGAWQAALQFGWLHDLQIGRDIVFPHGPYGAFYAQLYHPDLVGLWYLIRLPHAAFLAVGLVWTLRILAGCDSRARLIAAGLALVVAAAQAPGLDGIWMLPSFLLLGLAVDDRKTPPLLMILLVFTIALASLAKFSFLMVGLTALIAWTGAAANRRDRLAFLALPLYVATVAALWAAAGQEFATFPDWIRGSLLVGSGYGAAMSITSNIGDLIVFALLVALMMVGAWRAFRPATGWMVRSVVVLGYLGILMFVAKAGFVRHDGHAVIPLQLAVAAAVILLSHRLGRSESRLRMALPLLTLAIALAGFTSAHARYMPGAWPLAKEITSRLRFGAIHLYEVAGDLNPEGQKAADFRNKARKSRELLGGPHPRIAEAGSIDVYSYLSAPPILAGLPYHPRPVIQSYSSYLPALAEMDADFVRDRGAEVYVLQIGSIDNRPVMADGGPLWPLFLSLYDPVDEVPLGLLVERREQPLRLDEAVRLDRNVPFNTWVDLPKAGPGSLLYVRGEIRPSVLGRAVGLAFKPPQITITLRRADGGEESHRLVPGQFAAGFPLSPIITTTEQVRELFDGLPSGRPVTAFKIDAAWLQQAFWGTGFPLTVTEIHRPGEG